MLEYKWEAEYALNTCKKCLSVDLKCTVLYMYCMPTSCCKRFVGFGMIFLSLIQYFFDSILGKLLYSLINYLLHWEHVCHSGVHQHLFDSLESKQWKKSHSVPCSSKHTLLLTGTEQHQAPFGLWCYSHDNLWVCIYSRLIALFNLFEQRVMVEVINQSNNWYACLVSKRTCHLKEAEQSIGQI